MTVPALMQPLRLHDHIILTKFTGTPFIISHHHHHHYGHHYQHHSHQHCHVLVISIIINQIVCLNQELWLRLKCRTKDLFFSTIIVLFQKLDKVRSYPWKTTKIQDLHDINNNESFNIPISPGMKQGTSHYVRRSYRSSAAMAQATGCYERPVLKRTAIHDSTGRTTKGDLSSEGNEFYNRGHVVKDNHLFARNI